MRTRTIALVAVLTFLAGFWLRGAMEHRKPPPPESVTLPTPQTIIGSAEDIERERAAALAAIFGGGLPAGLPATHAAIEPRLRAAAAVELIPRRSYYFTPHQPNGKLAIWHVGHGQDVFAEGADPINAMLAAGFHVIGLNMPHGSHAAVEGLRPFLEPVALSLNYAQAQGFHEAMMAGLSGGGWTTTVYAALDPRIATSIPIAGSLPLSIHDATRDYEQFLPGLSLDYFDLYMMAASDGRRQIQILNSDDPCCFRGALSATYAERARQRARELGGEFEVLVVQSNAHEAPRAALMLALTPHGEPGRDRE